jgi:hypothetical protein
VPKPLNIVCSGRGWNLAPSTGECWGISRTVMHRRVDVMFEMHDIFSVDKTGAARIYGAPLSELNTFLDAYKKAADNNIPSYSLEAYEIGDLKFKKYPIAEILKEFKQTLFNSSIDYMIALAIYKKYEKIDVWGVICAMGDGYYFERPAIEFWRGVAVGRGIDINFHGNTKIGVCRDYIVYGYLINQNEFEETVNRE